MNKKQWIILIIVVILLILVIGLSTFFLASKKNKDKENDDKFVTSANDNSEVIKEQIVDGLKISNVMLVVKEEGSSFSADVTNISDKEIKGKTLEIIFKTSTDKKVLDLLGYFGDSIKPNETKQINTNTSRRLNKNIIKSVEYKINN